MSFVLGNLRETLVYAKLAAKCRAYSVMLSPTPNLLDGGSGTFARYKSLCGIIGATHVMADHINARAIFAPVVKTADPTLFLNIGIPIIQLIYLETPEGIKALQGADWAPGALDICFIQIDPQLFEFLLHISGKQAVDLFEQKEKYFKNRDRYSSAEYNNDWCWAVDGAPRDDSAHNSQRIIELKFGGLYVCAGSKDGNTYRTDTLTLVRPPFDSQADRGRHDLGPTSDILPDKFGGISGGGMWQVSFTGKNSIPEAIDEMFFSGICVSGKEGKYLSSRGPSALYDIFTANLDLLEQNQ